MNVDKIIRALGYIVYTALLSPVIVLALIITPIVWLVEYIRSGWPIKKCLAAYRRAIITGIQHDIDFIRTGKW